MQPSKGKCKDCGLVDFLFDERRQIVQGEGRCSKCDDLHFHTKTATQKVLHEKLRMLIFSALFVPGLLLFCYSLMDAQYFLTACNFFFCLLCGSHVVGAIKTIREARASLFLRLLRS